MSYEDFFTPEEIQNLRRVTLDELSDLTSGLDSLLTRLRNRGAAKGAVEELSRIFHTVGGSAALAGFEAISDAGSELEALMGNLERDAGGAPTLIDKIAAKAGTLKKSIEEKAEKESSR